jgi:hypothetical protein
MKYYMFQPQFRLDIAWPDHGKIGIEVQGGVWTQGRHVRGKGYISDLEKHNLGLLNGWRVFKIQPDEVCQLHIINAVKTIMGIK